MSMSFNGAEEEHLCPWPKNPVSRRRLDSHLRQWSERGDRLGATHHLKFPEACECQ